MVHLLNFNQQDSIFISKEYSYQKKMAHLKFSLQEVFLVAMLFILSLTCCSAEEEDVIVADPSANTSKFSAYLAN